MSVAHPLNKSLQTVNRLTDWFLSEGLAGRRLGGLEQSVALVLAKAEGMNTKGETFISNATIAQRVGCSLREAERILSKLLTREPLAPFIRDGDSDERSRQGATTNRPVVTRWNLPAEAVVMDETYRGKTPVAYRGKTPGGSTAETYRGKTPGGLPGENPANLPGKNPGRSCRSDLGNQIRIPRSGALQVLRGSTRAAADADNGKSTAPTGAARALKPKVVTTNPAAFRALVWKERAANPALDIGDFAEHVKTISSRQAVRYTPDDLRIALDAVEAREKRQRLKSRQRTTGLSPEWAAALEGVPNHKLKAAYRH